MMITEIRKTYKYRLYHNAKRDRHLHDQINISGIIWNHCVALQRRYYRLTGKYISKYDLQRHIAKLRMKTDLYGYWSKVGSQAVQEIIERLDKSYQIFFKKQGGRPSFGKVKKYRSFTLKQAGWKLLDSEGKSYGKIQIGKRVYKFVKHREMGGTIKTVTIKRDAIGGLWLFFSVIESVSIPETSTGKIGGFDFGLKTFLVNNEGNNVDMPQFYGQDMPRLRTIQSQVSKKVSQSNNHKHGLRHIARRHIRISDKRLNYHYQLAHELCDDYDVLVFEDLNIAVMKRLWGRKVSDLGFAQFLKTLDWVAFKRGKRVVKISRWEQTTGVCSSCGHQQKLTLDQRTFECQQCGLCLDRDHNAAINILEAGHRLILSQSIEDSA